MLLKNVRYFDRDFHISPGEVLVENGKILDVGTDLSLSPGEEILDCGGKLLSPGFVDVHIHGCDSSDTCDGTREAIDTMSRFLIKHGVTSFCPTSMTIGVGQIEKAILAAKAAAEDPLSDGARVIGINLEGPFISASKKGAQLESAILKPDFELFHRLYELSGGLVRLVTVAPEEPGGYEFAKKASKFCAVSIGHTAAKYDEAKKSFDSGVTHATHLFNAMTGFLHREPGVVGAIFDDERVMAELICDGIHIHPAVLRTAFRVLGDRVLIVSDSIRANGYPEGERYELGGQMVTVKGGKATLDDGTIAGSVTNLHDEVKNLVSFGVPIEQAIKAATFVPAKSIGLDDELGSIEPGKRADLLLLDEDLGIDKVFLGGKQIA